MKRLKRRETRKKQKKNKQTQKQFKEIFLREMRENISNIRTKILKERELSFGKSEQKWNHSPDTTKSARYHLYKNKSYT